MGQIEKSVYIIFPIIIFFLLFLFIINNTPTAEDVAGELNFQLFPSGNGSSGNGSSNRSDNRSTSNRSSKSDNKSNRKRRSDRNRRQIEHPDIPIGTHIPKILYQVTSDFLMSQQKYKTISTWTILNPEYKHNLYNYYKCREFFTSHGRNDLLQHYDNLVENSDKEWLFSTAIISIYGGFYCHSNLRCHINLDSILENNSADVIVAFRDDNKTELAILAGKSGSPILKKFLNTLNFENSHKEFLKIMGTYSGKIIVLEKLGRKFVHNPTGKVVASL